MARVMNFNPGPATLPVEALERAQAELLDLGGTGMSVIEHSHRGKAFEAVHNEAIALVRELLGVSDAIEQIGTPADSDDLHPNVAALLQNEPSKSRRSRSAGSRKRLGKSLKEMDATPAES